MLLCIDIGNTNIMFGLYRNNELVAHWRVNSDQARMPDEYGLVLMALMSHQGYSIQDIGGVALSSVVPPLTETISEMLLSYIGREPLVVGSGVRTGVAIRIDNPREVGADRIINVAAVYKLYGGPACIVDFGTATTFDAMSATGDYLGGAIAPGIRLAADALFRGTAKLPRIDFQRPPNAIGTNTVDAMRSGILYGYVGLVEGMVQLFRQALGPEMVVVATGGLAEVIGCETEVLNYIEPWLTLKGLRLIYELNRGAA